MLCHRSSRAPLGADREDLWLTREHVISHNLRDACPLEDPVIQVAVGGQGRDDKELAFYVVDVIIANDLRRRVLLLHPVRERASALCGRALENKLLIAQAAGEAQALVGDLEVLRHEPLALRERLVDGGDGTLGPGELGEVKDIALVLVEQLPIGSEGTAPRLPFLEVLDHLEVYSLFALEMRLRGEFRILQGGRGFGGIPVVELSVQLKSETGFGVIPRLGLQASQLVHVADEDLLLLHIAQELHEPQPVDQVGRFTGSVATVDSREEVQELVDGAHKLADRRVEGFVGDLGQGLEALEELLHE